MKKFSSQFSKAFNELWLVQFFIGGFIALLMVGLLVWGNITQWSEHSSRINSLLAMLSVYTLSFISIRRFTTYLGSLSFRYVFLLVFFWLLVPLTLLFVFRLPYSVYYLVFSTISMLMYLIFMGYIKNSYKKVIAYIPVGLAGNLPAISSVSWKRLEQPMALDKDDVDAITADLRANLSEKWERFLAESTLQRIPVYHSVRLMEMLTGRVKMDHLYENDLGSLLPSSGYLFVKRSTDILLILCSLPVVLPLMLLVAVLVVLESPGGVFFCQQRIGLGGKPFTLYKFRSMCRDSEKAGAQFAQDNDMRVTRIGRVIRKTRIDELPQFFNVLKGEMSLIGPRPEQKQFVDEFDQLIPFYSYRHIVKPGISGWAQVMQGYAADAEDAQVKLEHDFYYIKNFSFSLDLLIFFKTIQTMLTGFGAK